MTNETEDKPWKHRPICTVIQDIKERAQLIGAPEIVAWCDEAQDYARRMSAKLAEYKQKEIERGHPCS